MLALSREKKGGLEVDTFVSHWWGHIIFGGMCVVFVVKGCVKYVLCCGHACRVSVACVCACYESRGCRKERHELVRLRLFASPSSQSLIVLCDCWCCGKDNQRHDDRLLPWTHESARVDGVSWTHMIGTDQW